MGPGVSRLWFEFWFHYLHTYLAMLSGLINFSKSHTQSWQNRDNTYVIVSMHLCKEQ